MVIKLTFKSILINYFNVYSYAFISKPIILYSLTMTITLTQL